MKVQKSNVPGTNIQETWSRKEVVNTDKSLRGVRPARERCKVSHCVRGLQPSSALPPTSWAPPATWNLCEYYSAERCQGSVHHGWRGEDTTKLGLPLRDLKQPGEEGSASALWGATQVQDKSFLYDPMWPTVLSVKVHMESVRRVQERIPLWQCTCQHWAAMVPTVLLEKLLT